MWRSVMRRRAERGARRVPFATRTTNARTAAREWLSASGTATPTGVPPARAGAASSSATGVWTSAARSAVLRALSTSLALAMVSVQGMPAAPTIRSAFSALRQRGILLERGGRLVDGHEARDRRRRR